MPGTVWGLPADHHESLEAHLGKFWKSGFHSSDEHLPTGLWSSPSSPPTAKAERGLQRLGPHPPQAPGPRSRDQGEAEPF